MPIHGGYETVSELNRGALGAAWSARRVGAKDEPAFVIKTITPDAALLGAARAAAAVRTFLERARAQQRAAQAAPIAESRWAQVYEIGEIPGEPAHPGEPVPPPTPAGAYMVTDLATRGTVERLAASRTPADARTLGAIIDGVVTGLRQIGSAAGGGRAHGRLTPANVLLLGGAPGQAVSGRAASRTPRVALADPAGDRELDAGAGADDLRALGNIIHLLVLHEPFRGQLPLDPGPAWDRLGKAGPAWRELAERLLDPSGRGVSFEDLAPRVGELRRIRRSRTPVVVALATLALVAGGVGVYVVAERARQRQAAPLPETLWGPEPAARWATLCDAYRTWYGSLLTRLDQRPPTAAVQHRTRRAWYAALDAELGAILEPHSLARAKGADPWSLAGVESGADLTTLAANPTTRARSDASVERVQASLVSLDQLRAALAERWSGTRRIREIAATWRARGWESAAAFAERVGAACAPEDPSGSDLAGALDDFFRTRPVLERIETRWAALEVVAAGLAKFDDPLLRQAPAVFASMISGGGEPGGAAPAAPSRDDLVQLEMNLDVAGNLANRLQIFVQQEWGGIDTDSFRASPRYAELAAAPPSGDTFEGWLFEVRGHARLDPALDPRAGWDERAMLEGIDRSAAALGAPPLGVALEEPARDRIEAARAAAAEIAPAKLPWNRRNREAIETQTVRVRREVAAIQAELDSRIAARREELATTAEQVREQLRARATISPDSPALNAAWVAGRDRALEIYTGLDFERLREAARGIEGELTWASRAFGTPHPGDDLDGRVRRPAGAKPALWAVRVADAAATLREEQLGAALAAAGRPEADAFRPAIEPLARRFRERVDELAAHVAALEVVQARLDAGDPLADETGPSGRLGRAVQTADELAAAAPGAADALAEIRQRLGALSEIARESAAPALLARIRDARPDRPEAALAAWRRLGSPQVAWPATLEDLRDGAAVRDALLRVAASIPDPARRDELAAAVRAELAERWLTLAQRTPTVAAFESIAAAAPDFAVNPEQLPASMRFNVALANARAGLARRGLDEPAARELAGRFAAVAERIGGLPQGATQRLALLGQLLDGAEPELPSTDPLTLGPGAAGWRGQAEESGNLVFTSGNAQLEFTRLEIDRSGERVPVYLGVSEISVGQFAQIIAHARGAPEMRQALPVFDPGTATWAGPRAWTWSPAGAVVPAPMWLKLDANVTPQRPAYPPVFVRANDFRRLRDEVGGEPSVEHPMQQIPPAAAALAARLVGCRLPATDEWRAARAALPGPLALSEWNLRDEAFAAQQTHLRAMQGQVVNKASFPWADAGILLPDQPRVPAEDRATSHDFDDGVLWFSPVSADPRHPIQHLLGNVAEFVFDEPDRMDKAAPTATAVQATLQQAAGALGAIGGSALSPPELPPETRIPVDLLFSTEGFADVGFRLAFTARGTRPPRETLASKILRILDEGAYLFAN